MTSLEARWGFIDLSRATEGPGLGTGQREGDKAGTCSKHGEQGLLCRIGSCPQIMFPRQMHWDGKTNTQGSQECPKRTDF